MAEYEVGYPHHHAKRSLTFASHVTSSRLVVENRVDCRRGQRNVEKCPKSRWPRQMTNYHSFHCLRAMKIPNSCNVAMILLKLIGESWKTR